MSRLLLLGAGGPASVANLAQGSNTFDGTRVWTEQGSSGGSMALTSGPAITNGYTGETYWAWSSGIGAEWRFDTLNGNNTLTPAGSTRYTTSLYVKKNVTNQIIELSVRTLGGTDATSFATVNTTGWTSGGTLDAAHNGGGDDAVGLIDLGGNEGRLRVTITTPSGTNRLLIQLFNLTASSDIYISSSMINLGGLATYSLND